MDKKQSFISRIHTKLVDFAAEHLYTEETEIKDRCYLFVINLNILGTLAVIPAMFFAGHILLGVLFSICVVLFISQLLIISKFKKYISFFEKLTCVCSELIIIPVFFMSGGLSGGGLFFFLMVMVFAFLVLRGYFRIFNLIISIIGMILVVISSLRHPEWCLVNGEPLTPEMSAFSTMVSCIVCGFVILSILSYQLYLYVEQDDKVKKAMLEAEHANNAKSMFLANMSHEIRTPIGIIMGLSEMIQNESNINAIHDMSANIGRSSGMLLNIINDILDFEKINKGKMEIVNNEYFSQEILSDLKTLSAGRAEAKGLKYSISLSDTVPEVLFGDESRLRQIGTNIVNNAIKYTETGSIDISMDYDTDREMLILSVTDTGKGIKEEDLPNIFDVFQRVDIRNNRSIEGTGLGLAITKKLAEAMGGSISVTSEYGVGSTFTVEVAHSKVDNPTISHDKPQIKEYHFDNTKLLYVDDTKLNMVVFNGFINGTGINATYAFSGSEAIEIAKSNTFDIILLDYFMPEMDGVETLGKLRELGVTCPIIVITADAVNGAKDRLLDSGFDDYLSKPIQRNILLDVIDKYSK